MSAAARQVGWHHWCCQGWPARVGAKPARKDAVGPRLISFIATDVASPLLAGRLNASLLLSDQPAIALMRSLRSGLRVQNPVALRIVSTGRDRVGDAIHDSGGNWQPVVLRIPVVGVIRC